MVRLAFGLVLNVYRTLYVQYRIMPYIRNKTKNPLCTATGDTNPKGIVLNYCLDAG